MKAAASESAGPNFSVSPKEDGDLRRVFGLPGGRPGFPWPVLRDHAYAEYVPRQDPDYAFDPRAAEALLAGFVLGKPVLLTGPHGCGKSSAVEQAAAALNRPCMRLNLDSFLSRSELIGRDAIALEEGKQVTSFREGPVPWCARRPFVLILDEYDAARPDALFLFQRLLEADGHFILPETNLAVPLHPEFRLAATANTAGGGDETGLYAGTRRQNAGHMDRWALTCAMTYPPEARERAVLLRRFPDLPPLMAERMARLCALTRAAAQAGDLAVPMSLRALTHWAQLALTLGQASSALRYAFAERLPADEKPLIGEFYQRCFGEEMEAGGA